MAVKTQKKEIHPLGDRVLIKPLESKNEGRTASGIIIPGKDKEEKHERGTIVSTGPGRLNGEGKRVLLDVKAGDIVWWKRGYDFEEVEVDGEDLILTSEGNIIAIEK